MSCETHCCQIHGCKYAHPNCPVANGSLKGITGNCEICGLETEDCEDAISEEEASYRKEKGIPRKEWHESQKFKFLRMLNNRVAQIGQIAQEMREIFDLLEKEYEDSMMVLDAWNLVERQLRVTELESKNLWSSFNNLSKKLEPKIDLTRN